MEGLPHDVADALVRALGAYVRAVPRLELPNQLRPLQAFRPKALLQRRGVLLRALDDEATRNDVLAWLKEAKPDLATEDVQLLRLACERPDGWEEQLRSLGADEPEEGEEVPDARAQAAREDALTREREKTRRARDEARRIRAAAAAEVDTLRKRVAEVEKELEGARAERDRAEAAHAAAERERAEALATAEKETRRARRAASAAEEARGRAERELKSVRREATSARREVERVQRRVEALEVELGEAKARPPKPPEPRHAPPEARQALPVPKGRFEDDPQTLEVWLGAPGVRLVVDGYNVTLAEQGFGELELEQQRERLVNALMPLVQRKNADAVVVFDGNVVEPAARRAFRGPVKVEYSRPGEKADDHLVALLESLPPDPVIAVTNDRELRERLRAYGATIAASEQLLALIR